MISQSSSADPAASLAIDSGATRSDAGAVCTRTLGAAQDYAAANGYVGLKGRRPALFAAGVSMVDGHPVESAFESWAKDYVGLFAALAVYEAASATADPNFARDEAWPLLQAVAEYVVARGEWTARGFEFGLSMNRDESMPRVTDASTLSLFGSE